MMVTKRPIDLKHHIEVRVEEGGVSTWVRIVKTGNDVPVPDDEPLVLFRGRDRLAVPMLMAYRDLCQADGCNDFQLGQVNELIKRFQDFAATSDTMKQPGITRGK